MLLRSDGELRPRTRPWFDRWHALVMQERVPRLPPTGYLDRTIPEHVPVLEVVESYGLLSALSPFDACVVGTFPIGLAVEGSDIDIVCEVPEPDPFAEHVTSAFGHLLGFSVAIREDKTPWRVVARFRAAEYPVEIFGEPTPVTGQFGYRHMVIEHRLLRAGGRRFRDSVVLRRHAGAKTEPAFATVLGLPGDPYAALLDLEQLDDRQLETLVRERG